MLMSILKEKGRFQIDFDEKTHSLKSIGVFPTVLYQTHVDHCNTNTRYQGRTEVRTKEIKKPFYLFETAQLAFERYIKNNKTL